MELNELIDIIENNFELKCEQRGLCDELYDIVLKTFAEKIDFTYKKFENAYRYNKKIHIGGDVYFEFCNNNVKILCPHQGGIIMGSCHKTLDSLYKTLLDTLIRWY